MRLTYKLEKPIDTKYLHYDYLRIADYDISRGNYGRITDSEIYNKLGQLEDIEKELGIDLLIREKALRNGCWYKSKSRGIIFCPMVRLVGFGKVLELRENKALRTPTLLAKTCDYGKWWALTKEELL